MKKKMFEVSSNIRYDSEDTRKQLTNDRHQALTKAMCIEASNHLQSGGIECRTLDCL